MTDKMEGLITHNANLNKIICESLQTALLMLLKEKDYSKINITELCKKAGVSRMAFYNNFKTLDNLLESIVIEYNRKLIINKIGSPFREYTKCSWYFKLFECIKENSEYLTTLFNAGFKEKYLAIINNLVLHDSNIATTKKYLRIIWAGGIVNTIIYWIEHNMQESVEEIAKFCDENMSVYMD